MNDKHYEYIEKQFKARMSNADVKPTSKKYKDAQADFFSGAMSAMCAAIDTNETLTSEQKKELYGKAMPPRWVFSIMRGDIIVK
jgi:hypothetical protein